ncbi:hypothetical protein BKP30_26990 [Rhodococcus erythropolis]|nr:hypothetical protein BKP30_26990 [Rhodococcus erythropolis]
MKKKVVLVFASVVAILLGMPGTASANHSLGPTYHWLKKPWDFGIVVEIADRSDGASGGPMVPFPLNQASWDWDNGTPNVSLGYRWWNCSSAVANCVTVWEDNSLGQGTFGQMSVFRSTTSNGVTHMLDVHVQLNPDPLGNGNAAGGVTENATQARKTTCHELGHALGLAHIADTTSCMPQGPALDESTNPPTSLISTVPNQHDFDTITAQHNHTHRQIQRTDDEPATAPE